MKNVRFGIIGVGNIGTVHVRYLLSGIVKDATLTAVCDNAPEKHPAIRQLVGESISLFSDAQEMLQSGLMMR
jgi:predicted dehydrogenase